MLRQQFSLVQKQIQKENFIWAFMLENEKCEENVQESENDFHVSIMQNEKVWIFRQR